MSQNRSQSFDDEEDNYIPPHDAQSFHGQMPIPVCPKCHSLRIETRNRARRLGGAIGALSGAASAMLAASAKARAVAGLAGGPGAAFSIITSSVLAALISGAASSATGVKLGEVIDEKILNNYLCHSCGNTFSLKHS
ncbi:MAG: hypothetical protein CVU34_16615 [Betaproteobacteria bacterium HGW-Betaproteobacteria-7]|jgi:NAD(P)H-hydrate repair Nnr-like enzyme with NAD(P)H-hydrate dehydratase domain|nr:MAG: hypothetical protein CVU34_16615 [Betaproteobacteria bacterium HGW-Betaproteobacteria-7]